MTMILTGKQAPWHKSLAQLCRESLVSDKWVIDELEDVDIGSYLGIPRQLLPEVFFDELPSGEELHPRGGCQGLEANLSISNFAS